METISRRSLATSIAAVVAAVPTLALSGGLAEIAGSDINMVDRVRAFAWQLLTASDPMQTYGAWLEQWRIGNELLGLVDGNAVKINAISGGDYGARLARVDYHTKHLAAAMRDLHGVETKVLAYDHTEGKRPMVMVVALT